MPTTTTTTTEQQRRAIRAHAKSARWHGRWAALASDLADRQSHVRDRAEHLAAVAAILEECSR